MKSLVALCFLAIVAITYGQSTSSTGSRTCEAGTHAYTTGCGYLLPEATCKTPKPVIDKSGIICDYSACYCDKPTVRDTVSGKCVALDKCPKQ